MIRYLTLSVARLVAAVVLLVLGICALEVGLRAHRLWTAIDSGQPTVSALDDLVEPSRITYREVRPLLDLATGPVEQSVRVRTNELGLRGEAVEVPKPRGTYRVLCLGSEDTFAADVDELATWSALLRDHLQRQTTLNVEVLNAGCPQAGPLVHLLRCKRLLALQPDLVVISISPRDVERDLEVRRFLKLDEAGHPAYASHPQLSQRENVVDSVCREFYVAQWLADTMGDQLLPSDSQPRNAKGADGPSGETLADEFDRQLLEAPLVDATRLAGGVYARCLVVVSPVARDLTPRQPEIQLRVEHYRQLLGQISANHQIPLCDLTVDLRRHPHVRQLYSRDTGLLSPQGHALIASRLSEYIVGNISGAWGPSASTLPPNLSQR